MKPQTQRTAAAIALLILLAGATPAIASEHLCTTFSACVHQVVIHKQAAEAATTRHGKCREYLQSMVALAQVGVMGDPAALHESLEEAGTIIANCDRKSAATAYSFARMVIANYQGVLNEVDSPLPRY